MAAWTNIMAAVSGTSFFKFFPPVIPYEFLYWSPFLYYVIVVSGEHIDCLDPGVDVHCFVINNP